MSTKVISLTPKTLPPNKETIRILEHMLKEAKNGSLQSFIAITLSDTLVMNSIITENASSNYIANIGMLEDLKQEIIREYYG